MSNKRLLDDAPKQLKPSRDIQAPGKSHFECKKNKGEHERELVGIKYSRWMEKNYGYIFVIEDWQCIHCLKMFIRSWKGYRNGQVQTRTNG